MTEPKNEPNTPASPLREMFASRSRTLGVVALLTLSAIAVPAVSMALVVQPALARIERLSEAIERDTKAVEHISVPPSNDKLFTVLSKAVGVTEDVPRTTTVGTTPDAAFVADIPVGDQSDAFTQEFIVQNTDVHSPSQNLCVKSIPWSSGGGATCALKCAAATITCSAAATDGWKLTAGGGREYRQDGTNCVCVVGSAAGTAYQDERVIR